MKRIISFIDTHLTSCVVTGTVIVFAFAGIMFAATGCEDVNPDQPRKTYWIVYSTIKGAYWADEEPSTDSGKAVFRYRGKLVVVSQPFIVEEQ